MAGTFPSLSSGQVCMFPVQRSLQVRATIHRFADDTQQRYLSAPILNAWTLSYKGIKAADLATLQGFFDTQKGAFDKTWTFPFAGTSYTAMAFDQDDFTYVESADAIGRFSLSLKLRQVAKSGSYSTGLTATFPAIRTGVVTQLPFTTSRRYKTLRNDLPSGQRYSYALRSTPRHAWTLEFPALTPSEMGTLFNFFAAMYGPLSQFQFTDPQTGTVYTKCTFAMDALDVRYVSAGVCATRVEIEEFA